MKCDELTFIKEFVEISGAVLKVDENDNGVTFTTTYMPRIHIYQNLKKLLKSLKRL